MMKNKAHPILSDLIADLLIIQETDLPRIRRRGALLKNIRYHVPLDVLVLTPRELRQLKEARSRFIAEILKQGIVLYEQTVEKCLKGLIYQNGENPPKTHDRAILLEQTNVPDDDIKLTHEDLQFLNSVYLETRYPPDLGLLPEGEPSEEDEKDAARIAEIVFVLSRG
jgi:HEPN domain-containing protein